VTRVVLRGAGLDYDGNAPPDLHAPALARFRQAWRSYLGREGRP
jgi:hypothetical protein